MASTLSRLDRRKARVRRTLRRVQGERPRLSVFRSSKHIYAQIIDMTSTLAFAPETVSIRAGDTVLWRNQTAFTHSVIFDPQKATDAVDIILPQGVEPFASGDIPPGARIR